MARRRANGEGSIFKHKGKGLWCSVLTVGAKADGKPIRRYVYGKTQAEVRQKLEALKRQHSAGIDATSTRRTLGEWLDTWLEVYAKPAIRESTYVGYEAAARIHIKPRIGRVQLSQLKAEHVDRMISGMANEGLTVSQQGKAYTTLRRAMNVAMKRRVVTANPCQLVDSPNYKPPKAGALTDEQVAALIAEARERPEYPLVALAIASGFRLGELLGLQWPDIDFKNGTATVRRAQSEIRGVLSYGEPKTEAGLRTITLDEHTLAVLSDHRKAMLAAGRDMQGLVFVTSHGNPIRRSRFRTDVWYQLLADAGLPRVKFHLLRHTSATLMLKKGVHPKIAQARLGHSKIEVTLNTYSHVTSGMDAAAASLLGDAIKPKKKGSAG
jgi:integrase